MRKEILRSLDNIDYEENESFLNVTDAMLNFYEKQQMILENCDEYNVYDFADESFIQESSDIEQEKNLKQGGIINKIWSAIKHFFRMIAESVKRLIDKITGRSGATTEDGRNVISCDSIVLRLLSNTKQNVPDNTHQWPIPKVNPKYTVNKNDGNDDDEEPVEGADIGGSTLVAEAAGNPRYIIVNVPAGNGSVFVPKQIRVPNNDIISIINNETKSVTFHQSGYGKWDNTTGTIDDEGFVPNVSGTKKPWTHSSRIALYLLTDAKAMEKLSALTDYAIDILFKNEKKHHIKFNTACKHIIDDIDHAEKKSKLKEVTVSLKDLTDFQKKINTLIYKIDKFSDISTNVSVLDKDTMASFNNLYKKLLDVQISMNIVSSSFNTSLIINAHFIGCIKSLALLDEFVNTMIEEGVPPKYIAYNTWLAANECIRNKSETYKPIWGQTRFIFFPPNENICYKIAMSGAGITSNRAEIRTSDMFRKMDRVDLIAPIIKHFNNDAIVVMECIHSKGTPSYATCMSYTKRCNDAIAEYEKTHKEKLNIKIADQHKDNVKYDENNKCYRSIDYGIATRSFVKDEKPKKSKKK